MSEDPKVEPAPIFQKGGFAIEKRERDDVSVSWGTKRIRFPEWSKYAIYLIIIFGATSFTVVQLASLKWTGKPLPIRGLVEAQRSGSFSNRVTAIETTVIDHEKRIKVLEPK